jgi:hypothetical protein
MALLGSTPAGFFYTHTKIIDLVRYLISFGCRLVFFDYHDTSLYHTTAKMYHTKAKIYHTTAKRYQISNQIHYFGMSVKISSRRASFLGVLWVSVLFFLGLARLVLIRTLMFTYGSLSVFEHNVLAAVPAVSIAAFKKNAGWLTGATVVEQF